LCEPPGDHYSLRVLNPCGLATTQAADPPQPASSSPNNLSNYSCIEHSPSARPGGGEVRRWRPRKKRHARFLEKRDEEKRENILERCYV
jgi:hypothetical protein